MQLDIGYRLPDPAERSRSCEEMDAVPAAGQRECQLDPNTSATAETRMTHYANTHTHTPLKGFIEVQTETGSASLVHQVTWHTR